MESVTQGEQSKEEHKGAIDLLREMHLPTADLVDIVLADERFYTNEVFDYLWSMNLGEIQIYKLVSKCFFFQSEYVIRKLMTVKFPPSLIVIFIKRTKLGLSPIMLEFLKKNYPSGADMTYLIYDTPELLTPETLDLFKRRAKSIYEVMTVLDNAKGLTDHQKESLLALCTDLAAEKNVERQWRRVI